MLTTANKKQMMIICFSPPVCDPFFFFPRRPFALSFILFPRNLLHTRRIYYLTYGNRKIKSNIRSGKHGRTVRWWLLGTSGREMRTATTHAEGERQLKQFASHLCTRRIYIYSDASSCEKTGRERVADCALEKLKLNFNP